MIFQFLNLQNSQENGAKLLIPSAETLDRNAIGLGVYNQIDQKSRHYLHFFWKAKRLLTIAEIIILYKLGPAVILGSIFLNSEPAFHNPCFTPGKVVELLNPVPGNQEGLGDLVVVNESTLNSGRDASS